MDLPPKTLYNKVFVNEENNFNKRRKKSCILITSFLQTIINLHFSKGGSILFNNDVNKYFAYGQNNQVNNANWILHN